MLAAGSLSLTVLQPHLFRAADTFYVFNIKLEQELTAGQYIRLQFGTGWVLSVECEVLAGLTGGYYCETGSTASGPALYVRGFTAASRLQPIVLRARLTTPPTAATHTLTATTLNSQGEI